MAIGTGMELGRLLKVALGIDPSRMVTRIVLDCDVNDVARVTVHELVEVADDGKLRAIADKVSEYTLTPAPPPSESLNDRRVLYGLAPLPVAGGVEYAAVWEQMARHVYGLFGIPEGAAMNPGLGAPPDDTDPQPFVVGG